jgi:hypothetical protein
VPSTEAGVVDGMGKSNNCVKGRMAMQCSGRVALLHDSPSQFNILNPNWKSVETVEGELAYPGTWYV